MSRLTVLLHAGQVIRILSKQKFMKKRKANLTLLNVLNIVHLKFCAAIVS